MPDRKILQISPFLSYNINTSSHLCRYKIIMNDRLFDSQKVLKRSNKYIKIEPIKNSQDSVQPRVRKKRKGPVIQMQPADAENSGPKNRINFSKLFRSPFFLPASMVLIILVLVAGIAGYRHYLETSSIILHPQKLIYSEMNLLVSSENGVGGSGFRLDAPQFELLQLNPVEYSIDDGDTIYDIAKEYNILPQTLVSYNNITDTRSLKVGMKILIPKVDGIPYTVKSGDSISLIAETNNISINDLLDVNNLSTDIISPGQQLFIPGAIDNYQYKRATGTLILWPTSGTISSKFGYRIDPFTKARRFHYGIDIANSAGTRINSAIDGRVVEVSTTSVFGNYVVVEDRYGLQTYYAHLRKATVKKGQYVTQGQKIGEMGTTGLSTGNHLHFAVYKNGKAVDPMIYLQ